MSETKSVKLVKQLYKVAHEEVTAQLAKGNRVATHEQKQGLIIQNMCRICMEVGLNESIPFSGELCIDVGARLAAYAMTAMSDKDRPVGMARMLQHIPYITDDKLRTGARIHTDWSPPTELANVSQTQ